MTTCVSPTSDASPRGAPARAAEPAASASQQVALRLWRPTSTAVVLRIAGELDMSSAPRLQDALEPRLSSTAETIILDLSELRFLGVAGLELITQARQCAARRGIQVFLVDGPVCVGRALRAAGWREAVPTFTSIEDAVAELSGRSRENPPHVAS